MITKYVSISALSAAMVAGLFGVVPVLAESNQGSGGESRTREVRLESRESTVNDDAGKVESETETESEDSSHSSDDSMKMQRMDHAREEAKAKLAEIKANAQQQKLSLKKERCESMKARLDMAIPKASQGATSVKKKLDDHFARVQSVYASGKLTVANYDELLAAVNAAKTQAETILASVSSEKPVVDCTNASTGQNLDAYRGLVTQARTDLKEYHKALVALVSAMKSSAETATEEATKNESE